MKKNYFSGIVGGILGGILFSIPWILVYVFGNLMLSALALIIGIGILKGYQLFRGKVSKSLPLIICVIAIVIVAVETLFVIPMIELAKEGLDPSIDMLRWAYSIDDFKSGIFRDLAFSLVFTLLGVSSVSSSVKHQLNGDSDQVISYGGERSLDAQKKAIRDFFLSQNAISWDNRIAVDYSSGLDQIAFLELERASVIKKMDGLYYYSLEDENLLEQQKQAAQKKSKKTLKIVLIVLGVVVAILLGLFVIGLLSDGGSNPNAKATTVLVDRNHSFKINENYSYEADEDEELVWYVYLTKDVNLDKGYITVVYYDEGGYEYSSESEQALKDVFANYYDVTITSSKHRKTSNNLDMVELVLEVQGSDDDGDYHYFETINFVYTADENLYWIETTSDTAKMCNDLLNGSGIIDSIE